MKIPSQKQIESEIKKLETIKPKIPRTNFFGDNNHDKIDAQIEVLQEELSEDEVYDRFEDEENPDRTMEIVSNARQAALWLIGESDDGAPSNGWKELIRK